MDTARQGGLVDFHLHLSLGFLPPLAEQDYAVRMGSELARLVESQQRERLWHLQEPLVQSILPLLEKVSLHVQSVSYLDSYFNWALLTHPVLRPFLKHSLFLYLGLHPWFIPQDVQAAQDEVEQLCAFINENKVWVSGLGEIGLDKGAKASLDVQGRCLKHLLSANQDWDLPCSCHCVKAHNELLALLKAYAPVSSTKGGLDKGRTEQSPLSFGGAYGKLADRLDKADRLDNAGQTENIHRLDNAGQAQDGLIQAKLSLPDSGTVNWAGIIHGFNSSIPIAQRYRDLNFKLGLGLRWLNPQSLPKLQALLAAFPDGYCLETDTDHIPYQLEPLQRLYAYVQTVRKT